MAISKVAIDLACEIIRECNKVSFVYVGFIYDHGNLIPVRKIENVNGFMLYTAADESMCGLILAIPKDVIENIGNTYVVKMLSNDIHECYFYVTAESSITMIDDNNLHLIRKKLVRASDGHTFNLMYIESDRALFNPSLNAIKLEDFINNNYIM